MGEVTSSSQAWDDHAANWATGTRHAQTGAIDIINFSVIRSTAMRYLRSTVVALVVVLSATGVQGCRSGSAFEEDAAIDNKAHLLVKNDAINEMDIYAVADGVATRVGTVS